MKRIVFLFAIVLLAANCLPIEARPLLVENGTPNAQIVIAENPPRTTMLAAHELRDYIRKISGATLPIVTEAVGTTAVNIFVGQSIHAEALGVNAGGLQHGSYRIKSGKNWMALIGDDTNFVPVEPWPRNNDDIASGRMQAAWDEITGEHWGYTQRQLHKHYSGRNAVFGTPEEQLVDDDGNVNVWTYDERGSFNAVCHFLRGLGVRWYMPGEIGEIVPSMKSIPLPKIDETVHPDFPMRILNFRAAVYGRDAMMWGFRLGVRQPYGRQAAHGLHHMTHNKQYLTNNPEWFALYGGKRHTEFGKRLNQLCYSNEDLFQQAVRFARTQFDHFDMDVVSIMPPDGYTAICQCPLCEGRDQPDRGYRGTLSNYVWEFVNRVAKEVAKTHPEKLISNCAYGVYTDPPTNIDKLEPNVQVIIVGGRRPTRDTELEREELKQLRAGWAAKTDRPIEIFENYPFTRRNFYLPAYIPRVLGESINETKGISRGEDIWLSMDFGDNAIGFNHFLVYFTARMYWGGRDQDAVALFDEYCEKFYGPASEPMRNFFSYCEEHWRAMETDGKIASRALELFAFAKASASKESVYARRIQLIDNYLNGLRRKNIQLAQKRGPVPKLRLVGGEPLEPIVVDGELDDKAWQEIPTASTGTLRELQTGRQPVFGTSLKTVWQKGSLFFAIRCDEDPSSKLNIATTKNGDHAIFYGDTIEILLNTESHNYYQIVVNPAGAIVNLDRSAEKSQWHRWDSMAEVATQTDEDHWTLEMRIPVTDDENDPLHQVIGRKPTLSLPWYINVCRQRIRENDSEYSAFSPTGAAGFHKTMKFAYFYGGQAHTFPADESVTDYLIASEQASALFRKRKYKPAMDAYVKLAGSKKITDIQKSDALQHAAENARAVKDFAKADELADLIPNEAVAKTERMNNLIAQRNYDEIIDQFRNEQIEEWPFTQIGAAAFARAKALAATKQGEKTEADLQLALTYSSDSRIRSSILSTMGSNRELHLKDDAAALESYTRNIENVDRIGSADQFRSLLGAARILTRQQKFDEALTLLARVKVETLKGTWRYSTLLQVADSLSAAGRTAEALKTYRSIADDKSAAPLQRGIAEQQIEKLTQP